MTKLHSMPKTETAFGKCIQVPLGEQPWPCSLVEAHILVSKRRRREGFSWLFSINKRENEGDYRVWKLPEYLLLVLGSEFESFPLIRTPRHHPIPQEAKDNIVIDLHKQKKKQNLQRTTTILPYVLLGTHYNYIWERM